MTRRLVLAAVALSVLGGGVATATAAPASSTTATKQVCVVFFNDPAAPQRDGVCVWVPLSAQQ